MNRVLLAFFVIVISTSAQAQVIPQKFGKGLQVYGQDSSFFLKFGFRFQNLFSSEWAVKDGNLEDPQLNFLVRRSRLKFDGYAVSPKLKYKFELGLSNRDIGGGNDGPHNNAPRVILDAFVDWNFYKNWSIKFGQGKLAGNRERVISSGNLQFVDRSRLNSRYNIDRDMGIQLIHTMILGGDASKPENDKFYIKKIFSITQGEGRNVTEGNRGGLDYTFRAEFLPFGKFKSKGDYTGGDLKREPKPKLSVAFSYDINVGNVRTRGQNGSYIRDNDGIPTGKTLTTFFADLMYKHKGLSIMGEYVHKSAPDNNPFVTSEAGDVLGTLYTGTGLNLNVGYLMGKNWEIALRYTDIDPSEGVSNDEQEYTLGLSKYIVGHKLKVQTDLGYRNVLDRDNKLIYRMQMDIHF